MNIQELNSKQLYIVLMINSQIPHRLDGKYLAVFSDYEKARRYVERKTLYSIGEPSDVYAVTDCDNFFKTLICLGFTQFLFDGMGEIQDLCKIYDIEHDLSLDDIIARDSIIGYLQEYEPGELDLSIYIHEFVGDSLTDISHTFVDLFNELKRFTKPASGQQSDNSDSQSQNAHNKPLLWSDILNSVEHKVVNNSRTIDDADENIAVENIAVEKSEIADNISQTAADSDQDKPVTPFGKAKQIIGTIWHVLMTLVLFCGGITMFIGMFAGENVFERLGFGFFGISCLMLGVIMIVKRLRLVPLAIISYIFVSSAFITYSTEELGVFIGILIFAIVLNIPFVIVNCIKNKKR